MMALGNKGDMGDMGKGWLPPGKSGDGSTDMGDIGKGDMGKGWLPPGKAGDGSSDMGDIGKGDMGKGLGNVSDISRIFADAPGGSAEAGEGGEAGEGEPPAK